MALALHSRWMSVDVDTIQATGGASVNDQILHVMADVFGADVYRSAVTNSAALGAALRAWHADAAAEGQPLSWEEVTAGLARPAPETRIAPDAQRHAVYRELMSVYEACEALALQGSAP
jgi:xylulokinase